MPSISRSTTLKTIKRSATTATGYIQHSKSFKTIKRSGTQAWKWVNAEDTDVSQTKPVGISFFQRNDTIRKLNQQTDGKLLRSKTLSKRPTTKSSIRRRPPPPETLPLYSEPGFPSSSSSSSKSNKNAYYMNLDDTNGLYGEAIQKPETAASGSGSGSGSGQGGKKKSKKEDRVPSVLYDPEVRKQIEAMHPHKPIFMYTVTVLQILTFIISLILNMKGSGSPIAPLSQNIMIGPEPSYMIYMGARFSPCMKEVYSNNTVLECSPGIPGSFLNEDQTVCTISALCGMGMKPEDPPNQWYRFITPIFLHCGLFHILFNLLFQIRTGVDMEKDFGSWRIGIIYMATGIFGFVFGAYNSTNISVGCSGALYGLIGCLFLDLFQSWRIIVNPWKELGKMIIVIVSSFAIGLLNFIDNSAHVGGFISGILTGLIFLPTISFSKTDLRIKRALMILSVFLTTYAFIWVFRTFYTKDAKCSWCKYINCIDYKDWCARYE